MYRNQYDTDSITWSPQGRLFQVEYAMEAVKQGTCCVGVKSDTHVVLSAFRRRVTKLANYHEKMFKIDNHIGTVMSGITADAKAMMELMRTECLSYKYIYSKHINTSKLVDIISEKSQNNTQISSKRPFGVGLLIAGYDGESEGGTKLFETCPSGNVYEYHGVAFGSRCQAAKTYMEKNYSKFKTATLDELILHALSALKASIPSDSKMECDNISLGIVGADTDWKALSEEELAPFIRKLEPSA